MADLAWLPHTQTVVVRYPNGATSTEVASVPTSVRAASSKATVEFPPFQPGVFNIKPYKVSKTECFGKKATLGHMYTAPDGTETTWSMEVTEGCRDNSLKGFNAAPPDLRNTMELALQEAYGKLEEAVWDSGVDLAELGETFAMIGAFAKALSQPKKIPQLLMHLRDVLREHRRDGLSWADVRRYGERGSKSAANAWLCYRYGIMPLILSIQDALELLQKHLELASNRIRTKRRRPQVPKTTTEVKGSYLVTANYRYEWESRVEAIVYYKRDVNQTLSQLMGLTPQAIPGIVWEVCALSFVWDWFFNVGSLLSALQPNVGVTVLGSSVSVRHIGRHEIIQLFRATTIPRPWIAAPPFKVNIDSFERTVYPDLSKTPVFTGLDGMTVKRWIDSAALLLSPVLKQLKRFRSSRAK